MQVDETLQADETRHMHLPHLPVISLSDETLEMDEAEAIARDEIVA